MDDDQWVHLLTSQSVGPTTAVYQSKDTLKENLLELLNETKLCDVVLKVENKDIPAHKVILAAASEFFKTMFCGNFPDAQKAEIVLPTLSYKETLDVTRFAYGDREVLRYQNLAERSLDEIGNLITSAHYFQLSSAVEQLFSSLHHRLTDKTCVDIFKISNLYGSKELEDKSIEHINTLFDSGAEKILLNRLLKEPVSVVCLLISHAGLQISEDAMFALILKWLEDDEGRMMNAEKLLKRLHISLLSKELLSKGLTLLEHIPSCKSMLQNALKTQLNGCLELTQDCAVDLRSEPQPFVLKRQPQRNYLIQEKFHFKNAIVADEELDYESHYNPSMHISHLKGVHQRKPVFLQGNIENAVATISSFSNANASEMCIIMEEAPEELTICAVMPRKRSKKLYYWLPVMHTVPIYRHASFLTVNNFLFAAGGEKIIETSNGYCLRTVADFWVLDPRTMDWKTLSPMHFPRSRFALVHAGSYIYAVGGRKGNFSCELNVERFNLGTCNWEICAQLPGGIFENLACYNATINALFICYCKTTDDLLSTTRSLDKINQDESGAFKIISLDLNSMKWNAYVLQGASLRLRSGMGKIVFYNNFLYIFEDTVVVRISVEDRFCTETGCWKFPYDLHYTDSMFLQARCITSYEFPKIYGQTRSVFGVNKSEDSVCFLMNIGSLGRLKLHPSDCREINCSYHEFLVSNHCENFSLNLIESTFNNNCDDISTTAVESSGYPFFHEEKSIIHCGYMAFTRQAETQANANFEKTPDIGSDKCRRDFWDGFAHDDIPDYEGYYDDEDDLDMDDEDEFDDMFDQWMA